MPTCGGPIHRTMHAIPTSVAAPLLAALGQQLHRFFRHLDERRYDELLQLFTEDCRWLRQGQWLQGRPAVRLALEARAADMETRHVMSNGYVAACDGDRATLEAYMTAYRYPLGTVLPQAAGPLRMNLATTVFRLDPGHDWRIAEQRLVPAVAFSA